jgi:hypothetical protein
MKRKFYNKIYLFFKEKKRKLIYINKTENKNVKIYVKQKQK